MLAVAALSSFVNPFMLSAVNVALPAIGRDLGLGTVLLSWVPTSFLLASAVVLVPAGRIGDLCGRKRVYLVGLTLFTLATGACGLVRSDVALLAARGVQGAGAGMMMATSLAILTAVYPGRERGRVLGLTVAAVYTGLACGPFVGGFLTQQFGWRSIFLGYLPLGVLVVVMAGRYLPAGRDDDAERRLDGLGALVYAAGLITLMIGITFLPGWRGLVAALAGVLLLVGFVARQARHGAPLLDIDLFRKNRLFALSSLAALINYSATFAVVFLLSLYLQDVLALSPRQTGTVLVVQPLFMALLSPVAGRLSDRYGSRIIATTGMILTCVGLALYITLDAQTGLAFVIGCNILLGCGFALFSSPNMSAIMGAVSRRQYGLASGTVSTMRLLGQMLSMGVATTVLAMTVGGTEMDGTRRPEFLIGLRICFVVFTGLCALGVPASAARGRSRPPDPPEA